MSRPIVMSRGIKDFVVPGTSQPAATPPPPDPAEIARKAADQARQQAIAETEARLRAEFARERQQDQKRWAVFEQRLEELLKSMEKQIAEQLISVSIGVAETILRHAMPDQAMLGEVIRETLAPISDLQGVKVRMNPLDAAKIIARRNETADVPSMYDRIEIVADPSLATGDVMMESRNGYFDARIKERLALLEERLRQRYRNQHADHAGH
jgi:flagellar biosynthesis/type III secretory pathway protein FliH